MQTAPTPPGLLEPSRRVLFVFAHPDDELPYAGLISRAPIQSRFLWITNGDGLAQEAGMGLGEYADARRLESTVAMRTLGVKADQLRFLGHSEVSIYRNFTLLADPSARRHEVLGLFKAIGAQVEAEVKAFRPDVVFTLAWQGGHPEHDLTHIATRAALRDIPEVRFFELPEYELANTVLLRFPPWRRDPVHEVLLTPSELGLKKRLEGLYPTQDRIIRQFRTALSVLGVLSLLTGRRGGLDGFMSRETFGPVPAKRDYRRSPHSLDALEYVGDDFEGTPIAYSTMIAPLADALLSRNLR